MKNYINLKKVFLSVLVFIFVFNFFSIAKVSAQNTGTAYGDQAVRSLEGLSDEKTGLMPCNPFSDNKDEQCHPKDLIKLLKKLFEVALYVIVIVLFIMLVTSGLGYVFNKESPSYLNKMKKYIKNAVIALIIIIVVMGLIFGILASVNFDADAMKFLKEVFATDNFSFFTQAEAQSIPRKTTEDGSYINFFPRESIGSLILKIIRVITIYIVAPVLVMATIYTGFLFVKAQGKPAELNEAKKFAKKLAIIILITAAATTAITVILNTLNDISSKVKEKTSQNAPIARKIDRI